MKSFKKYIAESVKTYKYTIKIAGQLDKNFVSLFSHNLKEKFDAIDISAPVTTPIQKEPYGFPNLSNQSVTIIKANFRYPATEPMIQQVAQLLGYNLNMVRAISTDFNDSINVEADEYANAMKDSPLLTKVDLGEQPGAKEASKAYGDSYKASIQDQMKGNKFDIPYAAKKTATSFDPFKTVPTSGKSPMTKITLPEKPSTGSMVK
mgnify:CR=1 FL=1|tara:strand:+ start:580 stop:1197 length:618 start_codon:yes stop_codon:yes gene_type:complete